MPVLLTAAIVAGGYYGIYGMKYLMKGVIFLIVYKYSSSAGSCIYIAI